MLSMGDLDNRLAESISNKKQRMLSMQALETLGFLTGNIFIRQRLR